MRSARNGVAPLVFGLVLAACSAGAPGGERDIVATMVPVSAGSGLPAAGIGWPYPDGARVVRLSPATEPRELSVGLAAAGAPDVAPDGRRVLVAGRAPGEPVQAIYEIAAGERSTRRVYAGEGHCGDPAYLAHGAIVFVCETDAGDLPAVRALYVLEAGATEPERITWSPTDTLEPTPLADGRILFAMALESGAEPVLHTVNADGSLPEPFGDHHVTGPIGRRPRQDATGDIVVVSATGSGVSLVPFTRPDVVERIAGVPGGQVVAVEPDGETLLVVIARAGAGSIVRMLPGGATELVSVDIAGSLPVEAVPLRPTAAPRGRPRIVADTGDTGFLVGYDAGRTDGIVGPPQGSPVPHTVRFQTRRAGRTQFLTAASGNGPVDRIAGVTLRGDRSYFLEVPADAPLRVATVDAEGRPIATSSWFWVRPGETRACFGCHAGHAAAPVNRPIEAIQGPPLRLLEVAEAVVDRVEPEPPNEAGQ